MREFLSELSLKGWGDLNGMLATLNDGVLCREALDYWLEREWITRAPNSQLTALVGPAWSRRLTVQEFCGEPPEEDWEEDEGFLETSALTSGPSRPAASRERDLRSRPAPPVGEGEAPSRTPRSGRGEEEP